MTVRQHNAFAGWFLDRYGREKAKNFCTSQARGGLLFESFVDGVWPKDTLLVDAMQTVHDVFAELSGHFFTKPLKK